MKFRKYEKTYRILMPNINIKGKRHLTLNEEEKLFDGMVSITEKVDGGIIGIYKDFDGTIYYQKKGSQIDNSHAQYIFFLNNWVKTNYNLIKGLPCGKVYYMELMRCKHSIYYDKLFDYIIMFDIYDLKEKIYLKYNQIMQLCEIYKLSCVPLLFEGIINNKKELEKLMPIKSKFGNLAEGVVVKNHKNQMRGKIVKEEFIKMMDEHWRKKPIIFNKLFKGEAIKD